MWNGDDHYEVRGPTGFSCVVDMKKRSCACRKWDITGMPCKHAVAAIWNRNMYGGQVTVLPETLIHPIYTSSTQSMVG